MPRVAVWATIDPKKGSILSVADPDLWASRYEEVRLPQLSFLSEFILTLVLLCVTVRGVQSIVIGSSQE